MKTRQSRPRFFHGLAFALCIACCLPAIHDVQAAVPAAQSDLNGDGRSDMVWYNTASGLLYALQMNGLAPGAGGVIEQRPDPNWKVAAVADLNGDGKSDVVWQHATTGQVYGLIMNGTAIASEGPIYTEPNVDWKIVGSGDFDGDGKADLLWRNRMTGDVFLQLMNGVAATGGGVVYSEPNSSWQIQGVADFNGDGRADVLWRNVATGDVFVLLMNGMTVSGGGVVYSEPNGNWQIQSAADFDGDGKADILWRNVATGDAFMMLMNGLAITGGGVFYSEPSPAWQIAATGDYDGNGRADILWRNTSSGQVFTMLMNGAAIAGGGFVYTEPDQSWKVTGTVPAAVPANCVIKDKAALWPTWVAGNAYNTANAPFHAQPRNETWAFKLVRLDLFNPLQNAASAIQLYESGDPMYTVSLSNSPCDFTNSPTTLLCQRSGNSGSLGMQFVASTHTATDMAVTNAGFCRASAPASDAYYVNVRFSGPPNVINPASSSCTQPACSYYLLYQRII